MSDFESLWVDRDRSRDVDLSFNPMVVASSMEQILPCPRLKSCRWLYLAGQGHYQFTSWPGLPRVRGREGEYKQIMHIWRLQIVITYHEVMVQVFLPGALFFQWATPVAEEDGGSCPVLKPSDWFEDCWHWRFTKEFLSLLVIIDG